MLIFWGSDPCHSHNLVVMVQCGDMDTTPNTRPSPSSGARSPVPRGKCSQDASRPRGDAGWLGGDELLPPPDSFTRDSREVDGVLERVRTMVRTIRPETRWTDSALLMLGTHPQHDTVGLIEDCAFGAQLTGRPLVTSGVVKLARRLRA